jgi:hypothetical protein
MAPQPEFSMCARCSGAAFESSFTDLLDDLCE